MNIGIKVGIGFLVFQLLLLAGVPLETFITLLVVAGVGYPIGWALGSLIGDQTDVDTARFKAVAWANLVAWLFPIAGVAVARFTSSIGEESIKSRFFYDGMSILGYGLVLVTVALAVPLYLEEQKQSDLFEHAVVSPEPAGASPGERSFDRCPYAAVERWSEIEVEIYCNRGPPKEDMDGIEMGHKG